MKKIMSKEEAIARVAVLQKAGKSKAKKISPEQIMYVDKVISCIPGETVSAYIIIQKILEQIPDKIAPWASYLLIFVLMILTCLYLHRLMVKNIWQYIIVNLSFLVWSYSLGEPFKTSLGHFYEPAYASTGMIIIALLLPFIIKED